MNGDLRRCLDELGADVTRISRGVPLDHVGALTGQSRGPILFERIEGHPGWRICDLLWKNRTWQGRLLGVPPKDVVRAIAGFLDLPPLPARPVAGGPVKEVRLLGTEADLTKLPVPMQTARDPGPYLNGVTVLRDPATGVQNVSVVRTLVKGPREAISSYGAHDSRRILADYRARGERMPQALVVGVPPLCELAINYAGTHAGYSEFDLAGAMMGEPLELVACETVDLMVPAAAEVVIEGYVDPERLGDDGPSPSPNMTFLPLLQHQPYFDVTAVTMRHAPIYRNFHSTPQTDHQPLPRLFHEAILYRRLQEQGLDVIDVFFPPWAGTLSCIIQVDDHFEGQINDALMLVMAAPWPHSKWVAAMNADIDIYNPEDVYWALVNRVDPERDVLIVPNARGHPMDASVRPLTASGTIRRVGGKLGFDATKAPSYRRERSDFDRAWPMHWGEVDLASYLGEDGS